MKSRLRTLKRLVACVASLFLISPCLFADPLFNPPPEGGCLTNECYTNALLAQSFQAFTNSYVWPSTQFCFGNSFHAQVSLRSVCGSAKVIHMYIPPGDCQNFYTTNSFCPLAKTNWWQIDGPNTHISGSGLQVDFTPEYTGSYSVRFYDIWTNQPPCGYGNTYPGGITAITNFFSVISGGGDDSNGNGIPDWLEIKMGYNPTQTNGLGRIAAGYSAYIAHPHNRESIP